MLRACYGIGAVLCGSAEHVLWQWCMAVCAQGATLMRYGVHDKSLQYSKKKFIYSLTSYANATTRREYASRVRIVEEE
jgi:hypothetical protein